MPEHVHLLMGEPPRGDPSKVLQVLKQKVSRALRATRRSRCAHRCRCRFAKGKPEAIPIQLESPLVAQSFLAVHSKDWPWSSSSYYEKGENRLVAIEFAGAERNEREQTHPGTRKANHAEI